MAPRSYYFFPYDDSFVSSLSHSLLLRVLWRTTGISRSSCSNSRFSFLFRRLLPNPLDIVPSPHNFRLWRSHFLGSPEKPRLTLSLSFSLSPLVFRYVCVYICVCMRARACALPRNRNEVVMKDPYGLACHKVCRGVWRGEKNVRSGKLKRCPSNFLFVRGEKLDGFCSSRRLLNFAVFLLRRLDGYRLLSSNEMQQRHHMMIYHYYNKIFHLTGMFVT